MSIAGCFECFMLYAPSLSYAYKALMTAGAKGEMHGFKEAVTVKDVFPELIEKEPKLRKDIVICATDVVAKEVLFAKGWGSNMSPSAGVVVLDIPSQPVKNYLAKQEIAHVYYNDRYLSSVLASVASYVVAFTPCGPLSYCLPCTVGFGVMCCVEALFFKKIEDFMRTHATIEEMQEMLLFVEAQDATQIVVRNKLRQAFERTLEASHPLLIPIGQKMPRFVDTKSIYLIGFLKSQLRIKKAPLKNKEYAFLKRKEFEAFLYDFLEQKRSFKLL